MLAVLDIETTGLNRYKDKITWIGVALFKQETRVYEPYKVYTLDPNVPEQREKLVRIFNKLLKHKVKCIWQNGKFDTLWIEHFFNIRLPISYDVMLMGTAYELVAKHGLKSMAQQYLGVEDWDIDKKTKLSGDSESVVPYLKLDLKYTYLLYVYFKERMDKTQKRIYAKLLMPAYRLYRKVEREGIYFNLPQYYKVKKEYAEREQEVLDKLNKYYEINWNSSQQKADVLFNKEGLPIIKQTAKGAPSTDKSVLKRLAGKGFEIPQLILDYSALNTLNKMFLARWGDDAVDSRLHPSFNITNVISGRTSSSGPNLQQSPNDKNIRSLFTAPEGKVFFEADYSQLELRIAAHYANEPTMLSIYKNHGDIHMTTAELLAQGTPTKEDRKKAKSVNFGYLYGMQSKTFMGYAYDSYGVEFTMEEAEDIRHNFFRKYSKLQPWYHQQEIKCERDGGVYNLFGRFRALPDIYSQDKFKRMAAIRRAINTPVQGTGSDILLSAAIQVDKELGPHGLKIVGTVHDSILGEFYAEDEEWIVPEIRRIMEKPDLLKTFGIELKVNLEVDIGVGPWGSK